MEEVEIKKYLMEKIGIDSFTARNYVKNLKKFPDIFAEFLEFTKTGEYKAEGAVVSANWTAKALSEELPHLPVHIVYEFMIGLREEPELYQQFIAEGAPVM
jgi:hypothetical protein